MTNEVPQDALPPNTVNSPEPAGDPPPEKKPPQDPGVVGWSITVLFILLLGWVILRWAFGIRISELLSRVGTGTWWIIGISAVLVVFSLIKTHRKYGKFTPGRFLIVLLLSIFGLIGAVISILTNSPGKKTSKKSADDDKPIATYTRTEVCATCAHWAGDRTVKALDHMVLVRARNGQCTSKHGPWHNKQKAHNGTKCSEYFRWSALD